MMPLRFLNALLTAAFATSALFACAQRPTIEGAPCDCPEGFMCVDGRCRKDSCPGPCPDGFVCSARATCERRPGAEDGGTSSACSSVATHAPAARFFPLFPQQYARALAKLSGLAQEDIMQPNPPERILGTFYTVDHRWEGRDSQVSIYRGNADHAAAAIVEHGFAPQMCASMEQQPADCLAAFAAQAFRRPLETTERTHLATLLQAATTSFTAREAMRAAVSAVLQSPKFLYLSELGPLPGTIGNTKLTPYEIASSLSFFLTDEPPDAGLLAAAADGTLASSDVRAAHAERLLSSEGARQKARMLFMQLLEMDTPPRRRESSTSTQANFDALVASMQQETNLFLDHHIFTPTASYVTLFSTHQTFVDARLAQHYGLARAAKPVAFEAVDIPQRQGLLANGRFLIAHPNPPRGLPFKRGFVLQRRLRCLDLPAPPANAIPSFESSGGTARQRAALVADQDECRQCHRSIGELSLGFEHFDELGRHRTHDGEHLVDTQVSDGDFGTFTDGLAWAVALAESEAGQKCFLRQFLTFALADDVPMDEPGKCLIERLHARWKARGLHIPALLVEFIKDEVFVTRRFEG